MNKTVYIVATRHRYQGCTPRHRLAKKADLTEFQDFLKHWIRHADIALLAEEMNEEALAKYPHPDLPEKQSAALQVARQLEINHAYCEADSAMREKLSISENDTIEDRKKRERYWLKQLEELNSFPCLFVLREDHVDTFSALLHQSGFQTVIVARQWRPSSSPTLD